MKRYIQKRQVLILLFLFFSFNLFPQQFVEQTGIVLPGVSNGSVAWGDYDNDGYLDILVSGLDANNFLIVKVFHNNGNNTFTDQSSIFSPAIPANYAGWNTTCTAIWADFDNDGYLDILISGPSSTNGNVLMIYQNGGNNTFTLKTSIPYLTWQGNSVDCGDYDNDGDVDILLTANNSTKIYQNQGNFVFNEQYSVSLPGLIESSSKWGDYDNDGNLDIILTGILGTGNSASSIYRNQGNNSFAIQNGISLNSLIGGSSEWGDYNNDGFLDLLLTGNGFSGIYKNNGDNTFTWQSGIVLKGVSNGTGKWGDLNNDGNLDLIISGNYNGSNITTIYFNNGDNTFTEATSIVLDGVNGSSIDLGDYDNDGDLDILIEGNKGTSKICKVYRNNSSVINPLPAAPAGLTSASSGNDAILKWKPVTSDNTPARSLSYNLMVGTTPGGINEVSPNSSTTGFRRISGMGNGQLDTSFVLRNIKKGTYYWKVQAVDNCFKGGVFSTQSTFTYSASYQSFGLNVPVIGGKESTLTWSRGNGANCIVFLKEGNSGVAAPVNNTTYTASSVFKSGSQIGTSGWYSVYKGTLTSVNVTGLKANTNYIFQVIEFDGNAGSEAYNTNTSANNPLIYKTGIFTEAKNANLLPVTSPSLGYSQGSHSYWIDIDNDNDLDLLLVGESVTRLYRNDGNDVFTLLPVSFTPGYSASCGDYNNDGYIDIIINGDPPIIYKNNGNGTFTGQPGIVFPGTAYGAVAWGDYNNDGYLDLVITGRTSTSSYIAKVFKNNGNNTFTEQSLISLTGVMMGDVKWGDYDNDGFLDLLLSGVLNNGTDVTKVYHNDKGNNLVEQTGIHLPGDSYGMIDWGDYDNDGNLDLLVGSRVFHNNGNNTFTELPGLSLPPVMYGTAVWGDYNNDGKPDILLTGYSGSYSPFTKVYKNNGDNTFTEDPACSLTGVGFSSAAWGDYDNDGDLDIILTGSTSNAAVSKIYRNDLGVANIKPVAPVRLTSSVNKSDVNLKWNSVRTDITTPYKSMSYNIQTGTVSGGINIMSPNSSAATGYRRLAEIGNCNLDTTFLFKNLPFGTYYWSVQAIDKEFAGSPFSTESTFTVVPVQAKSLSATISDNNSLLLKWERGNGDRCAVFCKEASSGLAAPVNNTGYIPDSQYGFGGQIGSSGWYCVYDGRYDSVNVTGLTYQTQYSFHVIEYMGGMGTEQYFTQTADGNPGVFSTSLFTQQTGITLPDSYNNNAVWGDYDNDGFLDLLIPGFPTRIYHNNGDNTFTEKTGISLVSVRDGAAAWGDYDNDGDLDIIITGATVNGYPSSGPVTKIYRNDGNDIFTEQAQISLTPVYYSSVAWGDYNNDGNLDILLTGATGSDPNYNPVSKIYRNNGNGTFTEQAQIPLTGVFKGSAIWGDYDNDGNTDILLNGALDNQYYTNNVSKIYRNNGNNTFSEQTQMQLPGFSFSSAAWGDFDKDGKLDFIMTKPGQMSIYENLGNNQFKLYDAVYLPYQGGCSAAWGDYDNDGYLDIILTNPGLDTKIYRNTRGITVPGALDQWFNQQDDEGLSSVGYGYASWVDYDNDGDLDFILAKDGLPTIIYKNNLIMKSGLFKPNTAPATPTGLSAANSPSGVILKWNPVKNDETPVKSMTYNVRVGTKKDSANICSSNSSPTGFRKIPAIGNAETDTAFLLKNLPARKYFWSVQAVDQGFKGGVWSRVDSFAVKNILAFFSADTVCMGLSTTFTNQSTAYGDVIQNYLWNFRDGTTSILQNPTHVFSSPGTHNVSLVASSATNSDTLNKQVLVKAVPPVDFTASVACQGTETVLVNQTNTTGLNILSWTWDYGDGKGSTFQNPGSHGYLSAGDYQLTLMAAADNGCSGTIIKTVSVGAYPVAVITANTPLSFCGGDSVTLSVVSNPQYSYIWMLDSTGITNAITNNYTAKLTGNYSVEVTNTRGSCKTTSSKVLVTKLVMPATPEIWPGKYQDGKCPGENQIVLSVKQPVTEYSYQWKRNGTPISNATDSSYSYSGILPAGDYTVEVSQSGCKTESAIQSIAYDDAPAIPSIYSQGPIVWYLACSIVNASHYKWYYNGNLIPGADKYLYVANQNLGDYYVSIGNAKGCYTASDVITIPPEITGIEDIDPFSGLKIYPNPTSGIFTIEMDNQKFGDLMIMVMTQDGKQVLNLKFEKTTEHFFGQIDLSGQPKGMYLINMLIDKYSAIKKVIVE